MTENLAFFTHSKSVTIKGGKGLLIIFFCTNYRIVGFTNVCNASSDSEQSSPHTLQNMESTNSHVEGGFGIVKLKHLLQLNSAASSC